MNSKERVIASLNHEEPDKVPIDLGGNVLGIHIIAYKKLLEYLEIEDKNIRYYDFIKKSLLKYIQQLFITLLSNNT